MTLCDLSWTRGMILRQVRAPIARTHLLPELYLTFSLFPGERMNHVPLPMDLVKNGEPEKANVTSKGNDAVFPARL